MPYDRAVHISPALTRISISLLLVGSLAVATVGCGDESTTASTTRSSTTAGTKAGAGASSTNGAPVVADWDANSATAQGAPVVTVPVDPAPTELSIVDLVEGTGPEVEAGMLATVDYIGINFSNGVVFDASYGRAPFTVNVGSGSVIEGWDTGLLGMKVGGQRQLIIPPELGYGAQARGEIPANETLIFVVDLRSALSKPTVEPAPGATSFEIIDLTEGQGDAVQAGDQVSVQYVGVSAETGKEFDASWNTGQPFQFQVGAGGVIEGWDQGLVGMKAGGRRRLVIPASMAYGEQGSPPVIQPNETLVFVVDLLSIN